MRLCDHEWIKMAKKWDTLFGGVPQHCAENYGHEDGPIHSIQVVNATIAVTVKPILFDALEHMCIIGTQEARHARLAELIPNALGGRKMGAFTDSNASTTIKLTARMKQLVVLATNSFTQAALSCILFATRACVVIGKLGTLADINDVFGDIRTAMVRSSTFIKLAAVIANAVIISGKRGICAGGVSGAAAVAAVIVDLSVIPSFSVPAIKPYLGNAQNTAEKWKW